MSGIVFQEIRESKALAYSTYAAFNTPAKKEYPFSMGAYVGCQADKMKEAIEGMEQLLTQLPVSEKLFEQSRKSILNTISTTRTTKTGILFSYLSAKKRGLYADLNQATFQAVSGYQFADIQRFHKDRIANKPYTLMVLGSEEKLNMDVLQKHGAIKKLSLEELFGY